MPRYLRVCTMFFCILFCITANAEGSQIDDRYYEDVSSIAHQVETVKPILARDSMPYQTGWPVHLGGWLWNAVSFINADASGNLEVLCSRTTVGIVHLKNCDGTNFTNWPVSFGQYNYGAPVGGDIHGDGVMEIFTGANTSYGYAALYGWWITGGALPGFPIYFATGSQVHSSPVLSDLDYDGDLEIVFSLYIGDSTYVFHHDGTRLDGWPQASPTNVRDAPVVGDLDGDGDLEVVVVTASALYAWHDDGSECDGFPRNIGPYYTDGLAMGDLDGDGYGEIIVTTVGATNNVRVYDYDGTALSGWPQSTGASLYAEPCLGDLDNDGDLEIVIGATGIGTEYHVHAWHHTGVAVNGWPAITAMGEWCQSSAAIGDIDDDGDMEVVIGCDDSEVYAFHHDASLVEDWPITNPRDQVSAPVTLGDIDRDGDIEVGVGSLDSLVHIWDLSATLEMANIEWQTYHHDHWFTGWYHPIPPVNLSGALSGSQVELVWSENSEADVYGYNVYRSLSSGYPYMKLTDEPVVDTSFIDSTVNAGNTYYYVVTACITAGSESRYSDEAVVPVTAVQELIEGNGENGFWLTTPSRGNSVIHFSLREQGSVRIFVYNILGEEVAKIWNSVAEAGAHSIVWNCTDSSGNNLPGGIYFLNFSTGQYSTTEKLLLIR
ncbi:MAG: FG-GAP-like repeat-containing protein [candidate division WOR-3 bacterium]|nr:FG-GAP-like repeat-containing protein [candidate division WOR-3 bacterium]